MIEKKTLTFTAETKRNMGMLLLTTGDFAKVLATFPQTITH
jgi:hypothetical protein